MRIRILVTGGTFDKQYDELTGRLFFRDTHVPEMLGLGRCRLDVELDTVMMVDSLDLDEGGRESSRGAGHRASRRWSSRTGPIRWWKRHGRLPPPTCATGPSC